MKFIYKLLLSVRDSPACRILMLGLFIRFLLAPFTVNWDLLANTRLITTWDIHQLAFFYKDQLAVYPPLLYFLLDKILHLTNFFTGSGLVSWLKMNEVLAFFSPLEFRYIFFLKLPYLFAELTAAYLFSGLFDKNIRHKVLLLWMINPVVLFTVAVWSNIDIFPLALLIASMYFLKKNHQVLAAASLGLGISLKLFPIFAFPFLFFSVNSKKRLLITLATLLPVIITLLPVMKLPQFWNHVITGGYSKQIYYAVVFIGQERVLIYFHFIYFMLIFYYMKLKRMSYLTYSIYALLAFTPFFIFSKFNLQWFLWLVPLFLFFNTYIKDRLIELFVYLCYFGMVFFSQVSLNIGMLSPVIPALWLLDWPQKQLLGAEGISTILNSLHSLLAAGLAWIGYQVGHISNKIYARS